MASILSCRAVGIAGLYATSIVAMADGGIPGPLHPAYGALAEACRPAPGRRPPWYRDDIAGQPFYRLWLDNTASLCIDLTQAAADNPRPCRPSGACGGYDMVWRHDARTVFRGVGRNAGGRGDEFPPENEDKPSVADVFAFGLLPNQPGNGHIKLQPGLSHPGSGLVSTSYDLAAALGYGRFAYVIDAAGGIDVEMTVHGRPATVNDEIAFPGGVRVDRIRGVWIKRQAFSGERGAGVVHRYLPRPGHVARVPGDQMDIDASVAGKDAVEAQISLDGELVGASMTRVIEGRVHRFRVARNGHSLVPRHWFVAGLGAVIPAADEDGSCIDVPSTLQSEHTQFVQAWSGRSDGDEDGSGHGSTCVSVPSIPLHECRAVDALACFSPVRHAAPEARQAVTFRVRRPSTSPDTMLLRVIITGLTATGAESVAAFQLDKNNEGLHGQRYTVAVPVLQSAPPGKVELRFVTPADCDVCRPLIDDVVWHSREVSASRQP